MNVLRILLICILVTAILQGTGLWAAKVPSSLVNDVVNEYGEYLTGTSIYFRQKAGLKIERLPGHSYATAEKNMKRIRAMLKKLDCIQEKSLPYDDYLSLVFLRWELESLIEYHRYFYFVCPVAAYSSPIPDTNRFYSTFRFKHKDDLLRYLSLTEQYAGFIEELTEILKEQLRRKIVLPSPALEKMSAYLQSLRQPVDKSFLFVAASRIKSKELKENETKAFQEKLADVIANKVNPALKRMIDFVTGDYMAHAPERVGLWQYPGGKEFYTSLLKYYTSLDLSPEEVHRTGLMHIKQLNMELDKVREEIGFKGDLAAFRNFLKNDPRFRPKSAEEIGQRLMKFKKMADLQLSKLFKHFPGAPCAVKRLNPRLEATMTYGFYEPPIGEKKTGYYMYNASHLDQKSVINVASAALILHELQPGHHFQIALQTENKTLPGFRREYFLTAYSEGWAEYAAFLGHEMGLYDDPYERCGRIMNDIFMSVRLVVDTGMNYFAWPRKKAAAFMLQHTMISEREVESETLRYSTGIPGQALAYKTGHMKIRQLRQRAEKKLGKQFDIKEFHDVILGRGTLPLFLLEKHVDRYIDKTLRR